MTDWHLIWLNHGMLIGYCWTTHGMLIPNRHEKTILENHSRAREKYVHIHDPTDDRIELKSRQIDGSLFTRNSNSVGLSDLTFDAFDIRITRLSRGICRALTVSHIDPLTKEMQRHFDVKNRPTIVFPHATRNGNGLLTSHKCQQPSEYECAFVNPLNHIYCFVSFFYQFPKLVFIHFRILSKYR